MVAVLVGIHNSVSMDDDEMLRMDRVKASLRSWAWSEIVGVSRGLHI